MKLQLTRGQFAEIDEADYELVKHLHWIAHPKSPGRYYAAVRGRKDSGLPFRKKTYLHNLLMNPGPGLVVDHINSDPLDNRRANLRVCTASQNMMNMRKSPNKSSIYKGVCKGKQAKKWSAYYSINKKRTVIGTYDTELEAAEAYNAAVKVHFGEFAKLNVIEKGE